MDLTQALLFILVAVVMGWFAVGVIWNIRRGNAVLRWMQAGLPRLGEKTTVRWLGSSAVELGIAKAKAPFRRAELVLVMEPRDVPWFWLMSRLRGRRDMLIVRGQLTTPPPLEYDLLAPGSWSAREALGRATTRQWDSETISGVVFRAPATTRGLSRKSAPASLEVARGVAPVVWRLSCRREFPQLELHVPLPDPSRQDPADFFRAVRTLAERVIQP